MSGAEEADGLYDFLKGFPLDYPNYNLWLERCRSELESGYKKAYYASDMNSRLIGSIVFQPHKQDPVVLEIKNLRVATEFIRHGVGSVLELLAEHYAKGLNFRNIQLDTHEGNDEVIRFFTHKGFQMERKEHIYTQSSQEIVLCKAL